MNFSSPLLVELIIKAMLGEKKNSTSSLNKFRGIELVYYMPYVLDIKLLEKLSAVLEKQKKIQLGAGVGQSKV